MRSRTRRLTAAAALAVLLSGCGVGAESQPVQIDPHAVPAGLLAPASTPRTTIEVVPIQVSVYFAGTSSLVAVARSVSRSSPVTGALTALAAGPTGSEAGRGLTSPISTATPFRIVAVRKGTVSVDVPASFETLGGQDQIVAAAQLVYTLTGLPGVSGVYLLVGGQSALAPTSGGGLAPGPLTRADYTSYAPF